MNTTTIPYEVYVADSTIEMAAQYVGELIGDPHMYEFVSGEEKPLSITVSQLETDTPIPFSLIVVRENNQNAGVVEVGRLRSKDVVWAKVNDSVLGLNLLLSQTFTTTIGSGMYRIEVSTPENFGRYMLTIGTKPVSPGYFATLGDIRLIQKAFGKSIFAMFASSYVYYPLGCLVLSLLLFVTWKYRKRLSHA